MKCEKVSYDSRREAKHVLKLLNKHNKHEGKRVYYCETCFAYHITSQSREITLAIKRGYKFDIKSFVEKVKESQPETMNYWAEKFNIHRTYVAKIGKTYGLIFKHEKTGMYGIENRFEIMQFIREHPRQWSIDQIAKKFNVSESTVSRWKSQFDLPLSRKKHIRVKTYAKSDVIEKAREERRVRYKRITPTGISYVGDWDSIELQLMGG